MHRTISFFLRSLSLIRSKVPTSLAIFIQTVYFVRGAVILGQYFGLAKLNSLSFIPLNLFECAYLVIFTNYVRAMTGCNQSYTVKREITFKSYYDIDDVTNGAITDGAITDCAIS